jgi:hypothetical protein
VKPQHAKITGTSPTRCANAQIDLLSDVLTDNLTVVTQCKQTGLPNSPAYGYVHIGWNMHGHTCMVDSVNPQY